MRKMTNAEAVAHFDLKEILQMCADKIRAGEATPWIHGFYLQNRKRVYGMPKISELLIEGRAANAKKKKTAS